MEFEIDRFLVHFGRYTISQPEASAQVRSLDHFVHHPGIFMAFYKEIYNFFQNSSHGEIKNTILPWQNWLANRSSLQIM